MLKSFVNIEELFAAIATDKTHDGVNSGTANRFPVRFVLFDNFKDSYDFISRMSDMDIKIQSVDQWMNPQYDDMFISRIELANHIANHIEDLDGRDCVIAPFSELARFYDNIEFKEFDALITTLKAIQSSNKAYTKHQRVYIVVVGQYGKVSNFENDAQMFAWYLKSDDRQLNYRLVLSNGTDYGVEKLCEKYTVVHSIKEWLDLWRNGTNVTNTIISTSPAIYAYEQNALPDNAFNFDKCENVYKFLTLGLGLSFGNVQYKASDEAFWRKLAAKIDVTRFSFDQFINEYFQLFELKDYKGFIKAWHNTEDNFDKWLLVTYYLSEFDDDYLSAVLKYCQAYHDRELFEQILLSIFDFENFTVHIQDRIDLFRLLKYNGAPSMDAQERLEARLHKLAADVGYKTAASVLTSYTDIEKKIAIQWLGEGLISVCDIRDAFPDFYCYLQNCGLPIDSQSWIEGYIEKYKEAKFANRYDQDLEDIIRIHSGNELDFNQWYQDFKTVRTILADRSDIDVFYWIDGLGIDWIPVICSIIEREKGNGIYLNELIIGKALLPTTTFKNKADLEKLVPDNLTKIGDLDNLAHKTNNKYPGYIIEEFDVVKRAIHTIIDSYAGKKIAIISDHGMTYLSQHCPGFNLVGFDSDHHGRLAKKKSGNIPPDDKYIVVENDVVCSLGHSSLCGKVPVGQGAHGGATPEEVLVPIFIISNQELAQTWTAKLLTTELSAADPIVRFAIKGLKGEVPYVIYNGKQYKLSTDNGSEYHSSHMDLTTDASDITLCVGTSKQKYQLNINFGVVEDDLI